MCNIKVNFMIVLTNFPPFSCFSLISRIAGTGFKPFLPAWFLVELVLVYLPEVSSLGACKKYTKAENSIKPTVIGQKTISLIQDWVKICTCGASTILLALKTMNILEKHVIPRFQHLY